VAGAVVEGVTLTGIRVEIDLVNPPAHRKNKAPVDLVSANSVPARNAPLVTSADSLAPHGDLLAG